MCVEPQFHLGNHMLVDFLQNLRVLLNEGFLFIQYLLVLFREVFRVNLLHDKVETARSNEFADICGVAR